VQLAGETLLSHVIDPEIDDSTVQVDAVVRSSSAGAGGGDGLLACATKFWVTLFVAFTFQVRGVEPLEQEVVVPNVPMHTS